MDSFSARNCPFFLNNIGENMSKKTELSEKHWQMLKLLEDLPRKEVAEAIGISADHLDRLCCGNIEKCGYTATLFKKEYLKLQTKQAEETKHLVVQNTKTAQKLIARVFDDIHVKKTISAEDRKILSMYTNALSKFIPSVNIKNLSYSYTKGLTAEEMIHEFKRLKTVAESSFERGGISETPEGRARGISEAAE